MAEVRVLPNRRMAEAADAAAKRGHWLEERGGKVVEVIPETPRRNVRHTDPDSPPPAA